MALRTENLRACPIAAKPGRYRGPECTCPNVDRSCHPGVTRRCRPHYKGEEPPALTTPNFSHHTSIARTPDQNSITPALRIPPPPSLQRLPFTSLRPRDPHDLLAPNSHPSRP